jgi:hypothetical protein
MKVKKGDVSDSESEDDEPAAVVEDANHQGGHWRKVIRTEQEKMKILHGLHSSRLGK